jgi:hypothetical protein
MGQAKPRNYVSQATASAQHSTAQHSTGQARKTFGKTFGKTKLSIIYYIQFKLKRI